MWDHIDRPSPDACWNWTAATSQSGHGLAAIAGSIYVATELDAAPVVLLGLAIAIGCAIYAWTIVGDTENVRRQLWQREDAAGQDLDGDGHVGQPPVVTVGRRPAAQSQLSSSHQPPPTSTLRGANSPPRPTSPSKRPPAP